MATTRLSVLFLFCFIGYSAIAAPLVRRQSDNHNCTLIDYFKFANCLLSIQNKSLKRFKNSCSTSLSNYTQLIYEESSKAICGEPECTEKPTNRLAYKMTLVYIYSKKVYNNVDLKNHTNSSPRAREDRKNLDEHMISSSCTLEIPDHPEHSVNETDPDVETVWEDMRYLSKKIEDHEHEC